MTWELRGTVAEMLVQQFLGFLTLGSTADRLGCLCWVTCCPAVVGLSFAQH